MATAYLFEITDEAVRMMLSPDLEEDMLGDTEVSVRPGETLGGATHDQLVANGLGEFIFPE